MNGMRKEYEEQTIISSFWSWVILIVFPITILGWGMFVEMIVSVGPSRWDFGALPDTPSQSVYSTASPPSDVQCPIPDTSNS